MKWITDRDPDLTGKYNQTVLVTLTTGQVLAVCPVGDTELEFYEDPITNMTIPKKYVVAWCELPEPYTP